MPNDPKPPTPPVGTTSHVFTPAQVMTLLEYVDGVAYQLEQNLQGDTPPYMVDWNNFLTKARRDLSVQNSTWKDTLRHLSSRPTNWHDYVKAVLEVVLPVQPVLRIKEPSQTRNITLLHYKLTDDLFKEQMVLHHQCMDDDKSKSSGQSSTPSSIALQLKDQTQWELSISDLKSDMEKTMDKKMNELRQFFSEQHQIDHTPMIEKTKEDLKGIETEAIKLQGDIRNFDTA